GGRPVGADLLHAGGPVDQDELEDDEVARPGGHGDVADPAAGFQPAVQRQGGRRTGQHQEPQGGWQQGGVAGGRERGEGADCEVAREGDQSGDPAAQPQRQEDAGGQGDGEHRPDGDGVDSADEAEEPGAVQLLQVAAVGAVEPEDRHESGQEDAEQLAGDD